MRTRRELVVPGMDARSSLSPPSYTSLTVTGIFQTNCGTPYPIISSREQEPQVLALSSACHVAVARNLFILQLFQSFLNFHTIEVESCCCCCCFFSFCSLSLSPTHIFPFSRRYSMETGIACYSRGSFLTNVSSKHSTSTAMASSPSISPFLSSRVLLIYRYTYTYTYIPHKCFPFLAFLANTGVSEYRLQYIKNVQLFSCRVSSPALCSENHCALHRPNHRPGCPR